MSVAHLTQATQDYLKAIWSLGEWSDGGVTVKALAERLGVRTSSASDGLRKLVDQGFVEHAPYGAIVLTTDGHAHAVAMVRRHRLLETYLVQELGYGWDEVHDEAEAMEHSVTDVLIERIDAKLGHPTRDPHGDPIPSADGAPHLPPAIPLAELGEREGVVARISDADPERLRAFADAGIILDAIVTISSSGTSLRVGGEAYWPNEGDADAIWVIPRSR
jgi:DtxR family Mn-dependent transcriptional regulator